jgi:hypothetical protein
MQHIYKYCLFMGDTVFLEEHWTQFKDAALFWRISYPTTRAGRQ